MKDLIHDELAYWEPFEKWYLMHKIIAILKLVLLRKKWGEFALLENS